MGHSYLGKWFVLGDVDGGNATRCKVHDILFSDDVKNPIVFLMETAGGQRFRLTKSQFKQRANIAKL